MDSTLTPVIVPSTKRALLIKFAAIGDVVMAVPLARALYEQGYAIDWVCGSAVLPLLASYSWIHPIPAEDKAILRGSSAARARAIFRLWRSIAGTRYDLCATLYYDRRYRVLAWPVRAARKLHLVRGDRTREMLPGRHHTDELLRIFLNLEDGCNDHSQPSLRPDRLPPCPLPAQNTAQNTTRRIALVPAGASNMQRQQVLRRWPVQNYVALTERLLARGWEVVLLGGPGDEWVNPEFERLPVTSLIGKLTLPEVVSVCDACDGLVSHDTGPAHLAGMSRTPLLVLFGPSDPAMFLPRRPSSVGLWGGQGFACRPCYDGSEFAPCRFNGCMHQITVERALEELDRLLDRHAAAAAPPWRITVPFPPG